MSELLLEIDLGAESSGAYLLDGWGDPEVAHRWSIGRTSRLRLPVARPERAHVVMFDVVPWLHAPEITSQRVMVGLADRLAATLPIAHDMVFAARVPRGAARDGWLEISILHLDSAASAAIDNYSDGSSLGLMFRTVRLFSQAASADPLVTVPPLPASELPAGEAARALLMGFESLGHRCAFGLLQARHGADPLDLLRYAGIQTYTLVRELVRRFSGLGTPSDLLAFIREDARGLWSLYDRTHEIWFNTTQEIGTCTAEEVVASAAGRLPFLRRRFLAGLASGRRIYILNTPLEMNEHEALAVFTALNLFGRNSFVWTNQSGGMAPGTVQQLAPGFFYGQLDSAGEIEGDPSDAAWFSVCSNVRRLCPDVP